MKKSINIIFLSLLMSSTVAHAQSNLSPQELVNLILTEDNPTRLEFEAVQNKKIAKLITKFQSGNWVNTLTFQGDIDENDPNSVFADLDGLNNGTKATIDFQYSFTDSNKPIGQCLSSVANALADDNMNIAMLSGCVSEESLISDIESVIPTWRLGLTLSTNSEKFDWADPTTLASNSSTKSGFSIAANVTYTFNLDHQLKFSLQRQEAWVGGKKQSICVPNDSIVGALNCNDLVLGEATKKESNIFSAEWKTFLGNKNSYALAVKISHDIEEGATGIEVPIYIYQRTLDEGNTLNGGIRIGFVDTNNQDDGFSIGLFFNKPFSLSL